MGESAVNVLMGLALIAMTGGFLTGIRLSPRGDRVLPAVLTFGVLSVLAGCIIAPSLMVVGVAQYILTTALVVCGALFAGLGCGLLVSR